MTNPRARRLQVMLLAVSMLAPVLTPSQADEAAVAAKPQQFIYVLRVAPKYHDEKSWQAAENAAVSSHFKRLQEAVATGQVILAGRTTEALDQTFGIVIFEAASEEAARQFMATDPAVEAGVMTATLHPYAVALRAR
jgi:uncharacterized protein YciI